METQGNAVRQPAYGEPQRDERWYRYSVKCERVFAMRLEAAAAKAGLSVNAFVQAHFEAILDARGAAPAFDPAHFDALAFARRNAVSLSAARIWKEMRTGADETSCLRITLAEIEARTGIPYGSIAKALAALKEAGLLEQLSGAGTRGTQYRVVEG